MAKTMPPSGVLNAAATPAAAPATIRSCASMPLPGDSQRRACCITPAPTCTVGPSRPIDRPASMPALVSATLCSASRSDTRAEARAGAMSSCRAAITCGMPEPAASGAKRRVHISTATVSSGVQTSASPAPNQPMPRSCRWAVVASSVSSVKPTTTSPVSTA